MKEAIATYKVTLQNGEKFVFNQVENKDGLVCVHMPEEDCYGYGSTLEEALGDAFRSLQAQWG